MLGRAPARALRDWCAVLFEVQHLGGWLAAQLELEVLCVLDAVERPENLAALHYVPLAIVQFELCHCRIPFTVAYVNSIHLTMALVNSFSNEF